jgi:photosystem II stability/assembly factor-like uncharacterized protein
MRQSAKVILAFGLILVFGFVWAFLSRVTDRTTSVSKMPIEGEGVLWSRTSAEKLVQIPSRDFSSAHDFSAVFSSLLKFGDHQSPAEGDGFFSELKEGEENFERLRQMYAIDMRMSPDQRRDLYMRVAEKRSQAKSAPPYPEWQPVGVGTRRSLDSGVRATSGRMSAAQYAYDHAQGLTVLWASGFNGGLWKALNLGLISIWVPVSRTMPDPSVGAFLVDRTNSNHLLIGTGDPWRVAGTGLYRSMDAGATWVPVPLTPTPSSFFKILQDRSDPNVILAAASTGLYRSHTGGSTWIRVYEGNITSLVQDPRAPGRWYAGQFGMGVLVSTNSGVEFNLINGDGGVSAGLAQPFKRISLALCESSSNYVYALVAANDWTLGGVYRSADSGANWVRIHAADSNHSQLANLSIAVHPSNPDRVVIGLTGSEMSTNATAASPSWTSYDSGHADVSSFLFVPEAVSPRNTQLIATNDGGVYVTNYATARNTVDDRLNTLGLNVQEIVGGGNIAGSWSEPSFLLAGLQDNGIVTIDSDGVRGVGGADGGQVSISPNYADSLFVSVGSPWNRAYSYNRGLNWRTLTCDVPIREWAPVFKVDPRPGLRTPYAFTSAAASGLWFKPARDFVCDWRPIGSDLLSSVTPPFHANYVEKAMNPFYDVLYLSQWQDSRLLVYDSQFDGALGSMTSHQVRTPPLAARTSHIDDGHATADSSTLQWDTVYYTTVHRRPSQAFLSQNRGQSWIEVTGDLSSLIPEAHFYQLVGNPSNMNELFMATSVGVFYSRNQGRSWEPFSQGLPTTTYVPNMALQFDNASEPKLYIGTRGQGFWSRTLTREVNFQDSFE